MPLDLIILGTGNPGISFLRQNDYYGVDRQILLNYLIIYNFMKLFILASVIIYSSARRYSIDK